MTDEERQEREEDLASWIRCLDIELEAGDISQEEYERDRAYYERVYG